MTRRLTVPALLARCAVLAAGLVDYHVVLSRLIRRGGLKLGAVGPETAPLYAYWRPHINGWLVLAAAVLAVVLRALGRSMILRDRSDRRAIVSLMIAFLAVAVSVAMI